MKSLIRRFLNKVGNLLDISSKFSRLSKWLSPYFGLANFKKISIPLVKRIYPKLIAEQLVSVQPMTQPAALSYYLNYKYSSSKNNDDKSDSHIVF